MFKKIWEYFFPVYFKLRIRLYSSRHAWYIIEYNQGGFWTEWETLMVWHHIDDPTYNGMCWNPMMDELYKMEEYAKRLTSMEDIRRHYDREDSIRSEQLNNRKKYLDQQVHIKDIL